LANECELSGCNSENNVFWWSQIEIFNFLGTLQEEERKWALDLY